MMVNLRQLPDGNWQADVLLADGLDCHGRGNSAGRALIELGLYLEALPKPKSDTAVMVEIMMGLRKPSPTKPGNVRCMDCRCGGFDCEGMPKGYEDGMMKSW